MSDSRAVDTSPPSSWLVPLASPDDVNDVGYVVKQYCDSLDRAASMYDLVARAHEMYLYIAKRNPRLRSLFWHLLENLRNPPINPRKCHRPNCILRYGHKDEQHLDRTGARSW